MRKGDVVGHIDLDALKPTPRPEQSGHWSLFAVWPMTEEALCEKIGAAAYYPRRKIVSVRRGKIGRGSTRRTERYVPIIPGYIFYEGALDDAGIKWLYSDKNFIDIVRVGGKVDDEFQLVPARVQNADIHRMRMAELAGGDEVMEVFSVIVGEVLELHNGKYAGKTGLVEGVERGKVVLDLGRSGGKVKVSLLELEKISFKP